MRRAAGGTRGLLRPGGMPLGGALGGTFWDSTRRVREGQVAAGSVVSTAVECRLGAGRASAPLGI